MEYNDEDDEDILDQFYINHGKLLNKKNTYQEAIQEINDAIKADSITLTKKLSKCKELSENRTLKYQQQEFNQTELNTEISKILKKIYFLTYGISEVSQIKNSLLQEIKNINLRMRDIEDAVDKKMKSINHSVTSESKLPSNLQSLNLSSIIGQHSSFDRQRQNFSFTSEQSNFQKELSRNENSLQIIIPTIGNSGQFPINKIKNENKQYRKEISPSNQMARLKTMTVSASQGLNFNSPSF